MTSELKPCPFCGEPAYVVRAGTPRQSTIIECENCGAQLESGDQIPMHCGSWNRRPIEDALRAEVEALKVAEGEAMLVVESQDASIARLQAHIETLRGQRDVVATEVARLQAELARYTQPLTKDQACDVASSYGLLGYSPKCAERFDAAIREVRGK